MKNHKEEALALYKTIKSSDKVAEIISKKYGLFNVASLGRKIRKWAESTPEKETEDLKKGSKILIYDIETSPLIVYTFSKFPNYINDDDIVQDWKLITYSAKWLFEDGVISDAMTEDEHMDFDDERVTKSLWKLLDEADIVIGHNAKKFDNKKANSKFLEHGLPLPSSYHTIDTLLHARRKLGEVSNKLDWLSKKYGINHDGKSDSSGLWRRFMQGDHDAVKEMDIYCQNDVIILEDLYLRMRHYIQPHPNTGLFIDDNVSRCPCCSSDNLINLNKPYMTTVSLYDAYRCGDCGSLMRSKENLLSKDKRKTTMVSTPIL